MADECIQIRKLDTQKDTGIYGGGFLLSERKAAERKAAENRVIEINRAEVCSVLELSDREKKLVKSLG